jgi:hypothetical protein
MSRLTFASRKKINFMLDISSIVKYNSFMMNFDIFPAIQCKKQRKPLINNMLRHSFPGVDFTRSENSKSSTRLNNLWGESTGVSSLLSEGIKNTEQPDRQITYSFNKNNAQRYKRCVNISEPAAVGESLEERSLVIGHWSLGGGFEAMILNGCVIAWLLGIFLIVNC